eukprot:m.1284585 g.1284585  ORF g.1284585 m.1284585 type:complete len:68 (+) comp24778_c0_seq41:1783-1986(+)
MWYKRSRDYTSGGAEGRHDSCSSLKFSTATAPFFASVFRTCCNVWTCTFHGSELSGFAIIPSHELLS